MRMDHVFFFVIYCQVPETFKFFLCKLGNWWRHKWSQRRDKSQNQEYLWEDWVKVSKTQWHQYNEIITPPSSLTVCFEPGWEKDGPVRGTHNAHILRGPLFNRQGVDDVCKDLKRGSVYTWINTYATKCGQIRTLQRNTEKCLHVVPSLTESNLAQHSRTITQHLKTYHNRVVKQV